MSAIELPPEHLHALIDAAHRLGISRLVRVDGTVRALDLDTIAGRRAVFATLSSANRSFESTPTSTYGSDPPTGTLRLSGPGEVVQVLQWVRCYEYQCAGRSDWLGSDAQNICALLITALLDRLATMFSASWMISPTAADGRLGLCL